MNPETELHKNTLASINNYFQDNEKDKGAVEKQIMNEKNALIQKIIFGDGKAVIKFSKAFDNPHLVKKEVEWLKDELNEELELHKEINGFDINEIISTSEQSWQIKIKLDESIVKSINKYFAIGDQDQIQKKIKRAFRELVIIFNTLKQKGYIKIRDSNNSEISLSARVRWIEKELLKRKN